MIFPKGNNRANYNKSATIPINSSYKAISGAIPTGVGTNGGPSSYGTYDQSGNVWEWTVSDNKKSVCWRGGSYLSNNASELSNDGVKIWSNIIPSTNNATGFRIATNNNYLNLPNFSTIGDIGNNAQSSFGKVDFVYMLGTYCVTVCEYVDFLNVVAANSNEYELWNYSMAPYISQITNIQNSETKYLYVVNSDILKNKPVTNVTLLSAMRYCNWLHNGKAEFSSTEFGAYEIYGQKFQFMSLSNFNINESKYYIPLDSQWYKAAFYKGGSKNAGYWKYATQSNNSPNVVSGASLLGDGPRYSDYFCASYPTSTPIISVTPTPAVPNSVNYLNGAVWGSDNANLTTVGSNGNPSFYGTYDQNGNVWEWNDWNEQRLIYRSCCGGSAISNKLDLKSTSTIKLININNKNQYMGFRIASKTNPNNLSSLVFVSDINTIDSLSGFGAVDHTYYIGKYTVTNCEYAEFLNATASIFDRYNLFDIRMETSKFGGIFRTQSDNNTFSYICKNNMNNKPVNFINWFQAARYCNWLHNNKPAGQQNEFSTEDGAYFLNGATIGSAIPKDVSAKYYLPNIDEWYKAAYYKGSVSEYPYWLYATQSDHVPSSIVANVVGDGPLISSYNACDSIPVTPTAVPITATPLPDVTPTPQPSSTPQPKGSNSANWNYYSVWDTNNYLTSVGSNGGSSYYGTYDQSGLVYEWNDLDDTKNTKKGLRGGAFFSLAGTDLSSATRTIRGVDYSSYGIGFRIATKHNVFNFSDFAFVGDSNNNLDTTGFGSVNYDYYISKYLVTNYQYAEFLNSVAAYDKYGMYHSFMDSTIYGGIRRVGSQGFFTYSIKNNMENKPVAYVNWLNAARYCNWLHWNKPITSSDYAIETGAYDLTNISLLSSGDNAVGPKSSNSNYYIPTENEWYKAAFYKGGSLNAGYWLYATQSDDTPYIVAANSVGDGI